MSLADTRDPQHPHPSTGSYLAKAVLDRIGAAVLLVPCTPWLLLIATLLWFQDDRPVLTRETRIGQGGRRFGLLRFRTDATGVGAVLRRYNLDELPQLINVLKGDMSFVGPRPRHPEQARVEQPYPWLAVKPGLTRPWLPDSAPRTGETASLALDRYLRTWSVGTDLRIMWHALRSAVAGTATRAAGDRS
jgi:lipopolysaccharide/colanic/teichoic acid biosynthesis glycosyltransferase